jgi:1,4-alpha-glucan branching enzyme
MYAHPGKKLNFMGGEFGQWQEWDHDRGLSWDLLAWEPHRGMQSLVRDLNGLHRSIPAFHEVDFSHEGFEWIDFSDVDNSVASFLRRGRSPGDAVVCIFNFTPVVRADYRVGLPECGDWEELLNTDGACYGGSGVGNGGAVRCEPLPWNGRPCSVRLTLPPLGALFLRPVR